MDNDTAKETMGRDQVMRFVSTFTLAATTLALFHDVRLKARQRDGSKPEPIDKSLANTVGWINGAAHVAAEAIDRDVVADDIDSDMLAAFPDEEEFVAAVKEAVRRAVSHGATPDGPEVGLTARTLRAFLRTGQADKVRHDAEAKGVLHLIKEAEVHVEHVITMLDDVAAGRAQRSGRVS